MKRYFTKTCLVSCAVGASWLLATTSAMGQAAARPTLSFAPAQAPQIVTISTGNQAIEVLVIDAPAPTAHVTPISGVAAQPAMRIINAVPAVPAPPPAPMGQAPAPATAEARATFPRAEPETRRRTFTDLTAAPCFGHAPDYNWIIGQIEYSNISRQWRLRYASVDEVDRYGGRVTLVENQHVAHLVDGTYVNVRGHLVNPTSTGMEPTFFRVESFRTIDNPNAVQAPTGPR